MISNILGNPRQFEKRCSIGSVTAEGRDATGPDEGSESNFQKLVTYVYIHTRMYIRMYSSCARRAVEPRMHAIAETRGKCKNRVQQLFDCTSVAKSIIAKSLTELYSSRNK